MTYEVKLGKRNALYLPKQVVKALGIKEGDLLKLEVKEGKIIVKPIPDPFTLALKTPKFAKTTVEEFEKESEEIQRELENSD